MIYSSLTVHLNLTSAGPPSRQHADISADVAISADADVSDDAADACQLRSQLSAGRLWFGCFASAAGAAQEPGAGRLGFASKLPTMN